MKNPYLKVALLFLSVFILVGLACSFSTTPDPTATPFVITATPEPEEVVIVQPTPTTTQVIVQQPNPTASTEYQEPVTDDPPAYFIEEFDGDISSWTYFVQHGDPNSVDVYTDDGYLVLDLQGNDQYVYVLYDEYTYDSVVLDIYAENRGKNTNEISLVCNYQPDESWYEIAIGSDGMYTFWAYSAIDGGYDYIQSGGSTHIVTGRASNQYTAVCDGNYLALYINGIFENEVTDRKYNLREGQVGFSVSSFDVTPIIVNVDYFSIDYP